ncbi:MAG: alpha/beta hydrolase [Pseudomonadota bacterium]|nr:alpha/beta hydrolase [Pseudomonadota bacterium]
MRNDSTLSTFVSTYGESLSLHDWPLSAGWPTRGVVLLVHGLGEHVGRYMHVADQLNQWGFSVRGYDQHGHGESMGVRGDLPDDDQLLTDLASVIDDTRTRMDDRLPLILLGHSMGGLVAARLVSLKLRRVDALVLASPALDVGMSMVQKALVSSLYRMAPRMRLGNGLNARYLSHDHAVVDAYRDDPLVHDRISARLAHFIATAGPAVLRRAPRWRVPTLLLYAGQDRLVNPAGSEAFAKAAPARTVSAQSFPMHYHELFNELESEVVFEALRDWLTARFQPIVLGHAPKPVTRVVI